jgi:hypothetical protein
MLARDRDFEKVQQEVIYRRGKPMRVLSARIVILLMAATGLLQGCISTPTPSQGKFFVIVRGQSEALCQFAVQAGNVCGLTVPTPCKDVKELFYQCSTTQIQNQAQFATHFAQEFAKFLDQKKPKVALADAGNSMSDARAVTAQADTDTTAQAIEMIFTTGTSCIPSNCGGPVQYSWSVPCWVRCRY